MLRNEDKPTPTQRPIFIFGTYRDGARNHHRIRQYFQEKLPAFVHGRMIFDKRDVKPIPYFVEIKEKLDNRRVYGEIYYIKHELWEEFIQKMDTLESEGTFQKRVLDTAKTNKGDVGVWVYKLLQSGMPKNYDIDPSGDYFHYACDPRRISN